MLIGAITASVKVIQPTVFARFNLDLVQVEDYSNLSPDDWSYVIPGVGKNVLDLPVVASKVALVESHVPIDRT